MVIYHTSCSRYWYDRQTGENNFISRKASIKESIARVKALIKVGNIALAQSNITTYKAYFERYWRDASPENLLKVRQIFRQTRDLVNNEENVDVPIHVGTKHLSGPTTLYAPALNASETCSNDLAAIFRAGGNPFDDSGRFTGLAKRALLAPCTIRLETAETRTVRAYVTEANKRSLGIRSGTDMFINPTSWEVSGAKQMMPFEGDRIVQKGNAFRIVAVSSHAKMCVSQ